MAMPRQTWITVGLLIALHSFSVSAQHAPVVVGAERIAEVANGPSAAEGRVLMSELGCASCHDIPAITPTARTAGPDLTNVAARIHPEYLREWISDPHGTKPGTVMPDAIPHGPQRDDTVNALVTYLSGQGEIVDVTSTPNPDSEVLQRGEHLYHTVGCVACHDPFRDPMPRIGGDDEFSEQIVQHQEIRLSSVPLPDLRAKMHPRALAAFLMDPLAMRPSGRMPNMKLNPDEAKDIAAYLLDQSESTAPTESDMQALKNEELYARGREAFKALNCNACHSVESDAAPEPRNIQIRNANEGCLSTSRSMPAPWFGLTDHQRKSIQRALNPAEPPTERQLLNEQVASLNCLACHVREDLGGVEAGRTPYFTATIEADLGDEGRIPPPLTGVGAKLTDLGLTSMLVGDASVRSYMATRMPRFGEAQVGSLPSAFLQHDANPDAPEIDVSGLLLHHRNRYGRDLLGTNGFGCVGCHNLYGAESLGIPAIDLATVPDRIQPSWFKQYLLDPSELRPGTRMPTYFEDSTSPVSRVLRGNVDHQIEAMWIYLREIDQTRLPVGMEDRGDFELKPEDRPILLRTFMTDVGTHAIAVGYPEGVHVAFDAFNVRLVMAWRGPFVDAESTWADRFSPLASPLSEEQFRFPDGPAVSFVEDTGNEATIRFRGYRLDNDGIPTFMYSITHGGKTAEIDEYIHPNADGTIVRRFTITGNSTVSLRVQSPAGPTVISPSSDATTIEHVWRPQW